MIITLTLNPSIDYIMQVPFLRLEDTLRAQNAFFQAGGKGINVSRVLTRLDVENTAWAFAGGNTGGWLETILKEESVHFDFIETKASTRINSIITELSTHKQLRVSAPGGLLKDGEEDLMMAKIQSIPKEVQWFSLGGSLLPGLTTSCMRKIIERVKAQGIPCILDADGDVLKEGLQAKPYMIKPNQFELERLFGKPIANQNDIIEAGQSLIKQGLVEVVVTSLGKEGAYLISKDHVFMAKAPDVPVLSKVGAGDSMVAGMIKGLLAHADLADVLKMGIAAGTAAVMTPANELCQAEGFNQILPLVHVQELCLR